jgi:hypothetical protein
MVILSLTGREIKTLNQCERIIERGQQTFLEVGKALLKIKEQSLYRSDFDTFADYCEQRWGWNVRRAQQLIAAVKTTESVDANNCSQILTESQARELGKVPAEKREEVIGWAQEKADGKPLTAAAIRKAAEEVAKAEPEEEQEQEIDAPAMATMPEVVAPRETVSDEPPEKICQRLCAYLRRAVKTWHRQNPSVSAQILAIGLQAILDELQQQAGGLGGDDDE